MIYLFFITLVYLLCCLAYGVYAFEKIERFYIPYKRTKIDEKCIEIKNRVVECTLRLS